MSSQFGREKRRRHYFVMFGAHLYSQYSITRTVRLLLQYPRLWLLHYRILPSVQSFYVSVGACKWMNKLDASVKVVAILKEKIN